MIFAPFYEAFEVSLALRKPTRMAYLIVPATPTDYPTIKAIAHRTWPDTFGDILSPAQITYMLDMMYSEAAIREQVAKGHVFHLLREEADAIGYVSHEVDYQPGTTKIHKIYLLPETQGKGFGRALIDRVEQTARAAGQTILRLDVNYENKAIGFYEHLGFRKTERYNTDIGNGYLMEDWVMEKEL